MAKESATRAWSVVELFDELYDTSGEQLRSYGQTMRVTQRQLDVLVALAHVFPLHMTCALELIEQGKCVVYTYNKRKTYLVDKYIVSPSLWACPCTDFTCAVDEEPTVVAGMAASIETAERTKWLRACRHLLAVHIIEKRFPILDYSSVGEEAVPVSAISALTLHGPGVLAQSSPYKRRHLSSSSHFD